MLPRPNRRSIVAAAIAVGSVVAVIASTTSPAHAERHHHMATKRIKAVTNATPYAVSVSPHSTTTWALVHAVKQGSPVIGDRVLRRRGKKWSTVAVHAPKYSAHLSGIAAATKKIAWVSGDYLKRGTTSPHYLPLLARSTGSAFKRVKVPRFTNGKLIGVAASSRTNAWAVGVKTSGTPGNASFHWNGKSWRKIPMPNALDGTAFLTATVSTSGPTNAWMVGASPVNGIEHWDGRHWTAMPPPAGQGSAKAIASSKHGTWLVGADNNGVNSTATAWRWHKSLPTWTPITLSHPHGIEELDAVAAVGSTAYAVGFRELIKSRFNRRPIAAVLHSKKGTLSYAARPAPNAVLDAVSASTKAKIAVGDLEKRGYCASPVLPLAERLVKHKWKRLKIPARVVRVGKHGLANC